MKTPQGKLLLCWSGNELSRKQKIPVPNRSPKRPHASEFQSLTRWWLDLLGVLNNASVEIVYWRLQIQSPTSCLSLSCRDSSEETSLSILGTPGRLGKWGAWVSDRDRGLRMAAGSFLFLWTLLVLNDHILSCTFPPPLPQFCKYSF